MQKNGAAKLEAIERELAQGSTVRFYTYTNCTEVTPKTAAKFGEGELFKVDSTGSLFIRRGKNWDCVDGCKIMVEKA